MKETKIAKENVEKYKEPHLIDLEMSWRLRECEKHKQVCQREVIWLKEFMGSLEIANDQVQESNYKFWDYMKQLRIRHYNRDTDLKQAIKLYDEVGI